MNQYTNADDSGVIYQIILMKWLLEKPYEMLTDAHPFEYTLSKVEIDSHSQEHAVAQSQVWILALSEGGSLTA